MTRTAEMETTKPEDGRQGQPELLDHNSCLGSDSTPDPEHFRRMLREWTWEGRPVECALRHFDWADGRTVPLETLTGQFWTSRQRQGNTLHGVPYRACFKPQLPQFFIERLTAPGQVVYDPFMGRGTTLLEAALLGRVPRGCDANPLSEMLLRPRLAPPLQTDVAQRLREINLDGAGDCPGELLVFYEGETLRELCALRQYLLSREGVGALDAVDRWIRMVTATILTGHSSGHLSVYTLPPNMAVSVERQRKINSTRGQSPPRRELMPRILKKSQALLRDCDPRVRKQLALVLAASVVSTESSTRPTSLIATASVDLAVTSPPFLDEVDYAREHWLRWWFCGIDSEHVSLTIEKRVDAWQDAMTVALTDLYRVLRPGGYVAFEVGEVRRGTVRLEDRVIPAMVAAGLEPVIVVINAQRFTKTAHIGGVSNNQKGTNTNRIVLAVRPHDRVAQGLMFHLNKLLLYDPLRSDPRFQALLQRMNFLAQAQS